MSIQRGLLAHLSHCGIFWHSVTVFGHDSRAFGDHWVSRSLEGAMYAPLHVLVVLLCAAYRAFSFSLHFLSSPPLSPFFSFTVYIAFFFIHLVGSLLFFQLSVTGARVGTWAGSFWQVVLVAGLQLGQAL